MLRIFKLAKASAIKSRTQAINQLKAVLVRVDPALREQMTGLSITTVVCRCTELNTPTPHDPAGAAIFTLCLLARRILNWSVRSTTSTHRSLPPSRPTHPGRV